MESPVDSKTGCRLNPHGPAGSCLDRMVSSTDTRVPSRGMGDGCVSGRRHCPGHSGCRMDISNVGFSPAPGEHGHRSRALHENALAATPHCRRSNRCRGKLGRWASNYAFAVSRATAAAHSLLRKSWVGARGSDHPRGDGAFGEFSRFFVHFRRRWHGSQRPRRFLPGTRNRECVFPRLRSFAGSGWKSG